MFRFCPRFPVDWILSPLPTVQVKSQETPERLMNRINESPLGEFYRITVCPRYHGDKSLLPLLLRSQTTITLTDG